MIVAMPDGDNSWYATSNVLLDAAGCRRMLRTQATADRDCVAWPHYDDYVAYDVVRHLDAKYRTLASRERRAIAGLSMGGYGAVTLALQYPNTFGAAASHSGVLWPREFAPQRAGRTPLARTGTDSSDAASFGSRYTERFRVIFGADSAGWLARDPATLVARRRAAGAPLPAIFADCGTEDVFLAQNRAFRDALTARGVPIEYREWPGTHGWAYWRAHVGESLSWVAARIAPPPSR
jgi:S-formylglutathione hydrolase FrmB